MILNGPGVVLSLLVGGLLGAGVAFFRARTVRDVFHLVALGMAGFVLGQVGQIVWQTPWLRIGTVDLGLGTIGVLLVLTWWFLRHPVTAR